MIMTPQDKAKEYLSEFSKEKAIDVAETMKWYAEEFKTYEWVLFWRKVIYFINETKKI